MTRDVCSGSGDGGGSRGGCQDRRTNVQINGHKNSDKANQIPHTANAASSPVLFQRTRKPTSDLFFARKTKKDEGELLETCSSLITTCT